MVTIYILALEENKYYVGKWKPANVAMRIQQHFDGNGAKWTKKFRPKRVCSIHHNRDDREETRLTIEMMKIHGIPNVRGGSLSRVRLTKKDREYAKWKCGLTTKRPPATDRFARPGEASKKRRRKRRGNGACRTRKRYERIAKYGQCQARTKIAGGRQCRAPCEKGETTCRQHRNQRVGLWPKEEQGGTKRRVNGRHGERIALYGQCRGTVKSGRQCRLPCEEGHDTCHTHRSQRLE